MSTDVPPITTASTMATSEHMSTLGLPIATPLPTLMAPSTGKQTVNVGLVAGVVLVILFLMIITLLVVIIIVLRRKTIPQKIYDAPIKAASSVLENPIYQGEWFRLTVCLACEIGMYDIPMV